jgi:hypothetical protein
LIDARLATKDALERLELRLAVTMTIPMATVYEDTGLAA